MKRFKRSKNKFISAIIKSLKIDNDSFMDNLRKGENYETTIYQWSINLFDEGKAVEEAVSIINKRINLVLSNSTCFNIQDLSNNKSYKKVMNQLEINPIYSSLDIDQKYILQHKVNAFVNTNLYTSYDIVKIILNVIENTISNDTKQNTDKDNDQRLNSRTDNFSKVNRLLGNSIQYFNPFRQVV